MSRSIHCSSFIWKDWNSAFSRVVHSTEVELRRKLSKATDLDMILEVISCACSSNVHDRSGAPRVLEQDS